MRKFAVLLMIILMTLQSVNAWVLVERAQPGNGTVVLSVSAGYSCSAQRGCSPLRPLYVLYNGTSFRMLPASVEGFSIVGYINGSWILLGGNERRYCLAYNGSGFKVLFSVKTIDYMPVWVKVLGKRLYVYVERLPNATRGTAVTSIYKVSLNGSSTFLGSVEGEPSGIAFRDFLFVRTVPLRFTWRRYNYYVFSNGSFRWLASGKVWLDYFNGTLLLLEWGRTELNETLINALGFRVDALKVKTPEMSLGWNGTWYIYPDTTSALSEALFKGRPLRLYSPNGSLLGEYYVSAPGAGEAYVANPSGFVKLEGLSWYTDRNTGEWLPLSGYESFGWPVAFDGRHVYLYWNGTLHIWERGTDEMRSLKVGKPYLQLTPAGSFLLLYRGEMGADGGASNALYVYSNGSLRSVLDQLEGLFSSNESAPGAEVTALFSNGTSAFVAIQIGNGTYLYTFNGTFRYVGPYYPVSWMGVALLEGRDGYYVFNGSCVKPVGLNIYRAAGRYVLVNDGGKNWTLYFYNGGFLRLGSFRGWVYFRPAPGGVLLRNNETYYLAINGRLYRLPLRHDVEHYVSVACNSSGETCFIAYNFEPRPGFFNATLYLWKPGELKKAGTVNGRTEVLGLTPSGWVLRSSHFGNETATAYLYDGRLRPIIETDLLTEAYVVGNYLVVSNLSLPVRPEQIVYLMKNGVEYVGTFESNGTSYLSVDGRLLIGDNGRILIVPGNVTVPINGTVYHMVHLKDGVMISTDFSLYLYQNGRLIKYSLPGKRPVEGVPLCRKTEKWNNGGTETWPAETTTQSFEKPAEPAPSTSGTGGTPWGVLSVAAIVTAVVLFVLWRRR